MLKMSEKDKILHKKFLNYGANAKAWMKKCVLMLPKIEENRIWEKKGFESIYEYARIIAGMSRNKVNDSLRILRGLEGKPELLKVAKKKGLNAVRPVLGVANKETEAFWAEKAKEMSKNTLEIFVKDFRNGRPRTEFVAGKVDLKPFELQKIEVSMKLEKEVFEKLIKLKGGQNWNTVIKKLLEFSENKQQERVKPKIIRIKSHSVPVRIQKFIEERSRGKCEHPNCIKNALQFHHIVPFSVSKKHDPDQIVYLCKAHHNLIHLGYLDEGSGKWNQVRKLPNYDIKNLINSRISDFVKQYREGLAPP